MGAWTPSRAWGLGAWGAWGLGPGGGLVPDDAGLGLVRTMDRGQGNQGPTVRGAGQRPLSGRVASGSA
jgi:hypothetical protein